MEYSSLSFPIHAQVHCKAARTSVYFIPPDTAVQRIWQRRRRRRVSFAHEPPELTVGLARASANFKNSRVVTTATFQQDT
jgi:hypothetical protein